MSTLASTDAADVIFRDRCHAFLTCRWSCLLAVPDAARRLLHDSSDVRLTQDVLALVHEGELSRAVSRAQALDLAAPVATTIDALRAFTRPMTIAFHRTPLPLPRALWRTFCLITPGGSHWIVQSSTLSSMADCRVRLLLIMLAGAMSTWLGLTAMGPPSSGSAPD